MRRLTTKITSLALAAAVTAGLGTTGLAVDPNTGTVISDCVRLRREASVSSDSLGMLAKGDKVAILDNNGKGWLRIYYNDSEGRHTGYISADFVEAPGLAKAAAKKTEQKSAAKKTAAKKTEQKTAVKKTAAKKTAQKTAAKKTAAKKTEQKTAVKKTAAKKTTAKKTAPKTAQPAAADTSAVALGTGTVTDGGKKYKNINIRKTMSATAPVLCRVPVGGSVEILADKDAPAWYQVRYTDKNKKVFSGYMMGQYVDTAVNATPAATATVVPSGKVKTNVNLRAGQSTDAKVLCKVPVGERVSVLGKRTEKGWYQVSYTDNAGKTTNGYMKGEFVDKSNAPAAKLTGVVTTDNAFVYLRSEKSTDSKAVAKVPAGSTVTLTDGKGTDGWYQIKFDGPKGTKKGYMVSKYVKLNGISTATVGTSNAVLRASADSASGMLAVIPKDTQVTVLATLGDWYRVEYDGKLGYVDAKCFGDGSDTSAAAAKGSYGTVASDTLRMRSKRSLEATVRTTLKKGDKFQITSSRDGWYGITFNGLEGFVKADYVTASDTQTGGYVQVTAPTLTLRKGAGAGYESLGTIPMGTVLEVQGTVGTWYKVKHEDKTGYVSGEYVSPTISSGFRAYPKYAKVNTYAVTLRDAPSESEGEAIATITKGTVFAVYGLEDGWYRVAYGSQAGYLQAAYGDEDEGPATPISVAAPTPTSASPSYTETTPATAGSSGSVDTGYSGSSDGGGSSGSSSSGYSSDASAGSSYGSGQESASSGYSGGGGGGAVLAYARQFVGNPYRWGGSSLTNGTDCSGFVKSVYAHFGKSLPHSSSADRHVGHGVSVSEMRPGDIVCYSGHVGIYAGNGKLLSALGKRHGITYNSVHYKKILAVRRLV